MTNQEEQELKRRPLSDFAKFLNSMRGYVIKLGTKHVDCWEVYGNHTPEELKSGKTKYKVLKANRLL